MKNNPTIFGFIIGLIASLLGLTLTLLIFGKGNSIFDSLDIAVSSGVFTKLMSIGAILNLLAFFIFIQRNEDSRAKGVLVATVMVAITTVIVRFV